MGGGTFRAWDCFYIQSESTPRKHVTSVTYINSAPYEKNTVRKRHHFLSASRHVPLKSLLLNLSPHGHIMRHHPPPSKVHKLPSPHPQSPTFLEERVELKMGECDFSHCFFKLILIGLLEKNNKIHKFRVSPKI